ncbi:anthranilate N-methyltransferase [Arachis hypogaea]|uniref:anthranilate N-methyltransferase n=1 Tax=Arachis hypogaea TaxID=3818 RepID=UPI000DEDB62B|nr:anthranilate N-methyltransferase [Arachis hypogaea]
MLSTKQIASQIRSNNPEAPHMLDHLLRLLASHSLLRCSVSQQDHSHRLYSLSPRSKYFVTDADDGNSLGPTLALLLDNVFYQSWKEVKGAIMEGGIPFNRVYGMHAFEYPDERLNDIVGSAYYIAPKVLHRSYSVEAEIWNQRYYGASNRVV